MKLNWNFQGGRGRGFQTKNPSMVGIWIFSGTAHITQKHSPDVKIMACETPNQIGEILEKYVYLLNVYFHFSLAHQFLVSCNSPIFILITCIQKEPTQNAVSHCVAAKMISLLVCIFIEYDFCISTGIIINLR